MAGGMDSMNYNFSGSDLSTSEPNVTFGKTHSFSELQTHQEFTQPRLSRAT